MIGKLIVVCGPYRPIVHCHFAIQDGGIQFIYSRKLRIHTANNSDELYNKRVKHRKIHVCLLSLFYVICVFRANLVIQVRSL